MEYPDEKPQDFANYYDPSKDDEPWDLINNCCICGRISRCIDPIHGSWPSYIDLYKNVLVTKHVCSEACRQKIQQIWREEVQQYHSRY